MSALAWAVLLLSAVVILMQLFDRIAVSTGHPPGRVYNSMMLLSGLAAVSVHTAYTGGWVWAAWFAIVSIGISFLAEFSGTHFRIPFGEYEYTPVAGPSIGRVAVVVMIMWWLIIYGSMISALGIFDLLGFQATLWMVSLLSALLSTGWDLIGDPVAVHAGMWKWKNSGPWYGIPTQNFFGWFVVAALIVILIRFAGGPFPVVDGKVKSIFYLPVVGYAVFHLNFAGAAIHRKIPKLAWVGIVQAAALLVIYLFLLIQ